MHMHKFDTLRVVYTVSNIVVRIACLIRYFSKQCRVRDMQGYDVQFQKHYETNCYFKRHRCKMKEQLNVVEPRHEISNNVVCATS